MYTCGPFYMNEQSLDNQLDPIDNSSARIQDVDWRTFQERWTIKAGGERKLGKSMQVVWHDVYISNRIVIGMVPNC